MVLRGVIKILHFYDRTRENGTSAIKRRFFENIFSILSCQPRTFGAVHIFGNAIASFWPLELVRIRVLDALDAEGLGDGGGVELAGRHVNVGYPLVVHSPVVGILK